MTKARQHSIDRLEQAISTIEELAPQEAKRESQRRRKRLEIAHDTLRTHGPKLGFAVPMLGTFYRPEQYLEHAQQVKTQLERAK